MTLPGILQIILFLVVVVALTPPVGHYMYRVFESDQRPFPAVLGRLEEAINRLCGLGSEEKEEQDWQDYSLSVLLFSALSMLITYALLRLQNLLPLNPQGFTAVSPDLSFNTAASFTTNTNWQSYAGESTMSYLSQMVALAWHNFTSAAAGMGVALALCRGLIRRPGPTGSTGLGNFWRDMNRTLVYLLLPISLVVALIFVQQGVPQTFSAYAKCTTLEKGSQVIALGPVASQEVIKMLGINGGGFFNANSAHPFENPTPLTNFIQVILIVLIPAGTTFLFGRMAGDQKQGWTLLAAMLVLFSVGVLVLYAAETAASPRLHLANAATGGNMEGKELRFGQAGSALFATVTTDCSCGAVNCMHDSFTPLGGLVPLVNIQLGEIIFGGVGSGLYGILIYAILAVFIAGLMVGRTPEYLGKKIEGTEMKLSMLYILVFPAIILGLTGWASVSPQGISSLGNGGPHGLTEILYAYSSGAGNNGSAFAGLNANTPFWNVTLGLTMLIGRFWMMVPVLGIAGSMLRKKTVLPGPGTFPTDGPLFTFLLMAVIVIVGALTFFPALCLGPVVEHYLAATGKVF